MPLYHTTLKYYILNNLYVSHNAIKRHINPRPWNIHQPFILFIVLAQIIDKHQIKTKKNTLLYYKLCYYSAESERIIFFFTSQAVQMLISNVFNIINFSYSTLFCDNLNFNCDLIIKIAHFYSFYVLFWVRIVRTILIKLLITLKKMYSWWRQIY